MEIDRLSPALPVRILLDKDVKSSPAHALVFKVPEDGGTYELSVRRAKSVQIRIPQISAYDYAGGEVKGRLSGVWGRVREGLLPARFENPILQLLQNNPGSKLKISGPDKEGGFEVNFNGLDLKGQIKPAGIATARGTLSDAKNRSIKFTLRFADRGNIAIIYIREDVNIYVLYRREAGIDI
jgi:hypothetical protein